MVRAWFMNTSKEDQRMTHHLDPPSFIGLEYLKKLGVEYWKFDPGTYETDEAFQKIKQDNSYTYEDLITISPKLLPNYEQNIKTFYEEHIHTDDEIRYVLEGSGYFDVRDHDDRWVRIEVVEGDMIVLPAGIFHRFTLDTNNYIKALRLFVGEPVWTPHFRSDVNEAHPSRVSYKRSLTTTVG